MTLPPGGIDFAEMELLEFSIVSVPANPEATISLSAAQIKHRRACARRRRELDLVRLKAGGSHAHRPASERTSTR